MKTIKEKIVKIDHRSPLILISDRYEYNNRLYLGLIDKNTGEYFSDISINDPNIDLLDNEILVNKDFELCFSNTNEMRKRLEKRLNIKSWGINYGYYCFTL